MSTKKKGQITVFSERCKHLREYKRIYWKRERTKTKDLINSVRDTEIGVK